MRLVGLQAQQARLLSERKCAVPVALVQPLLLLQLLQGRRLV
jgi:hypothetical protein